MQGAWEERQKWGMGKVAAYRVWQAGGGAGRQAAGSAVRAKSARAGRVAGKKGAGVEVEGKKNRCCTAHASRKVAANNHYMFCFSSQEENGVRARKTLPYPAPCPPFTSRLEEPRRG